MRCVQSALIPASNCIMKSNSRAVEWCVICTHLVTEHGGFMSREIL